MTCNATNHRRSPKARLRSVPFVAGTFSAVAAIASLIGCGQSGKIATASTRPGDYDGDGKADLVIFRPTDLRWYTLPSGRGVTNGTSVNPSGGSLAGNPVIATGLIRIIEAASRVADGSAGRAVAHATNGQGLQHNLVCVLEGATS